MKEIALIVNWVDFKDLEKKKNQEVALSVLENNAPKNVSLYSFNLSGEKVDLNGRFNTCYNLVRDSAKEIGNTRHLPYVKEIFDNAAKISCDILGYINTDILLTKDFFNLFDKDYDAYIFGRYEIAQLKDFNKKEFKVIEKPYVEFGEHPGYDAFFFNTKWWLANRNSFHDDFIAGEPYWDMYYYKKSSQLTSKLLNQRSLYHVFHRVIWNTNSNGVKNNQNLIRVAR
jgi:hypothetical protein